MSKAESVYQEFASPGEYAGQSIKEMLEETMDEVMDSLMLNQQDRYWIGQARGIGWCLALMMNPYDPDSAYVVVKAEAVARWKERWSEGVEKK